VEKIIKPREDDLNRVVFDIDPELKRRFKIVCAIKNISQKNCLTEYIDRLVKKYYPEQSR